MKTHNNLSEQLFSYLIIGVAVVLGIAALIIFSWVLLWGAVVGIILYCIALIRRKFSKKPISSNLKSSKKIGRTFEHDDHSTRS